MSENLKNVLESKLSRYQQSHLLQFWDELNDSQRLSLSGQIQAIDFDLICALANSTHTEDQWGELAARAVVPPAITLADFADQNSYRNAVGIGNEALAAGTVAMILVAGGQGSRLGFEHPKGMYPIGPISNRSLYQMHIDQVRARSQQFGTTIPMYVMSSPPTHAETTQYLAENQNFGLSPKELRIFCQGTMPAVDGAGKMLLESKHQIFVSPDGHGGMLAALVNSGCMADMQERGIKHVFYGQVDNPLVQVCNPALIGYHIQSGSEMTSQVVRKTDPLQKVGNVVKVDNQVRIIEYSDLPAEQARMTHPDGSLKIWAGSIAVHVFETNFLERAHTTSGSLPFHRANKKVPFINADGKTVQPREPNATKFEKFIFDLLPAAKNSIVCEVDPADGFCAVKNAPPATAETPAHVKKAIIDLHTRWLHEAGVKVAPNTPIEINPMFAVNAEQLKTKMPKGITIGKATYFEG